MDELGLHLAPVLIGRGVRLFDNLPQPLPALTPLGVTTSDNATHLRYQVG